MPDTDTLFRQPVNPEDSPEPAAPSEDKPTETKAEKPKLADLIRKKHPGKYDDMKDEDLEKAVLAKHPQYKDLASSEEPRPRLIKAGGPGYAYQMAHPDEKPESTAWGRFKGDVKNLWGWASKPMTEAPTRAAEAISQRINPNRETQGARGVGSAYVEGLGHAVSGLTSPLNIGLTAATGGAGALASAAPRTAQVLSTTGRVLSAPVAAEGARDVYQGVREEDKSKILSGALEFGGGALGMRGGAHATEEPPVRQTETPTSYDLGSKELPYRMTEDAKAAVSKAPTAKKEEVTPPIQQVARRLNPFKKEKAPVQAQISEEQPEPTRTPNLDPNRFPIESPKKPVSKPVQAEDSRYNKKDMAAGEAALAKESSGESSIQELPPNPELGAFTPGDIAEANKQVPITQARIAAKPPVRIKDQLPREESQVRQPETGMVKLYRGESEESKAGPDAGRYFSDNPETALYYSKHGGGKGRIYSIELPADEAAKYRDLKSPEEGSHLLPQELADKARGNQLGKAKPHVEPQANKLAEYQKYKSTSKEAGERPMNYNKYLAEKEAMAKIPETSAAPEPSQVRQPGAIQPEVKPIAATEQPTIQPTAEAAKIPESTSGLKDPESERMFDAGTKTGEGNWFKKLNKAGQEVVDKYKVELPDAKQLIVDYNKHIKGGNEISFQQFFKDQATAPKRQGIGSEIGAVGDLSKEGEKPSLRDRIVNAYLQSTAEEKSSGGEAGFNQRARISNIRKRLPDVPENELTSELLKMQRDPKANADLLPIDNKQTLTKEDHAGAVSVGDEKRHLLWIEKDPRTQAPTKPSLFSDESGKLNIGSIGSFLGDMYKKMTSGTPVKDVVEQSKQAVPDLANPKDKGTRVVGAVTKLLSALDDAKGDVAEQAEMYRIERGRRFAEAASIHGGGATGASRRLGKMAGEYDKVDPSAYLKLDKADTDALFDAVDGSHLSTAEKLNGTTALFKLLNGGSPVRSEIAKLDQVFGNGFGNKITEMHGGIGGAAIKLSKLGATAKSMQNSISLAAPLRHGIGLAYRKEFYPAFRDMFKMYGDKEFYDASMEAIKEHPNYPLFKESGGFISKAGSAQSAEEEFMDSYIGNLPKWTGIQQAVGASQRGYTGFLNKLRFDTFNAMTDQAKKLGSELYTTAGEGADVQIIPTKATKAIAKYINTATGRGDLPFGLNKMTQELNTVLWSPRMMASRLTMFTNPKIYTDLPKGMRAEGLKSLLGIAALGTMVNGLGAAAGAKLNANPLSSDFGKVRMGNHLIDPWGGFQQYVVAASRLLAGKTDSSSPTTRGDIAGRFLANKEAPLARFAHTLLEAKTDKNKKMSIFGGTGDITTEYGQKTNIYSEAGKMFVPIFIQDLHDIAASDPKWSEDIGLSAILGVTSLTGMAQDYPEKRTGPMALRKMKLK